MTRNQPRALTLGRAADYSRAPMKRFVIPTPEELRALLVPLTPPGLRALSRLSGVSHATLAKLKNGGIRDPGIVTVSRFLPHVRDVHRVLVGGEPEPLVPIKRRAKRTRAADATKENEASTPQTA